MNKLEELEFLLRLQNQTVNTRSFDRVDNRDVEVYCRRFQYEREKTTANAEKLISTAEVKFKKVHDFSKKKEYLESLLYNSKLTEDIERAMIINIKKAINDRIKYLREKLKETLGLNLLEEKPIINDNMEEGGGTYEIDN